MHAIKRLKGFIGDAKGESELQLLSKLLSPAQKGPLEAF